MSEQTLENNQENPVSESKGDTEQQPAVPLEPEATVDEIIQKDVAKSQVMLKKRFRIYSSRPLSALDLPNAKAYVAEDLQALGRKVYALVVPPNIPIRVENLKEVANIKSAGLLELLDSGTVFWPLYSAKTKVLIYERPLGGRVMEKDDSVLTPVDEQTLLTNVFPTLFSTLEMMSLRSLTHRAVRPTNMYYLDEEKTHIVLGDCISVPPAYEQSVVFENISSAMCMPIGRGKGTSTNDLYSLAVSMVCLALGHDPLAQKNEDDVLLTKMQKGSYAALLEGEKVYLSLIDLLRGLLDDNPEHVWDIKTVKAWMDGQRQVRTSVEGLKSSQRPFLFENKEYFSYRSLAHAFATHWDTAAEAIKSEKLNAWISRGFNDAQTAEKITRVVNSAATNYVSKEEQEDYLITKVCMILDLQAPLRTRKFRLMPEGLSYLLSYGALNKADLNPMLQLISGGFLEMWYDVREDKVNRQYIKNLQKILSTRDLGMGAERCLYEMNEGLQCLSPMLEQEYIDDVRKILPALEAVSKKADPRSWPLDRHIVAYIAKHFGGKVGNQLYAINRPNASQATAGMLSLLAMLQWTFGPETLYGLTTWVGGLIGPVVDSYHNRSHRVRLEKELPKYIRKGNLASLYRYLDAQDERNNDNAAFSDAKQEYVSIQKEVSSLEENREDRREYYANLGYQVASILSFSIAILTMFFLLLYRFLRG